MSFTIKPITQPVPGGAVKPVGYMREKDSDGTAFWVSKTQNAYYGKPVYAAILSAIAPATSAVGDMVQRAIALVDRHLEGAKRQKDAPLYKNGVPMAILIQDLQELRDSVAALTGQVPSGGEK